VDQRLRLSDDPGAATPGGLPIVAAKLTGVSKSFPGAQALRNVDLEIAKGEIHALIGGNGSGKSTLVKVLAGVALADSGDLEIAGTRYALDRFTPEQARKAGLHFVHQEHSVFPQLTVAENLSIGRGFETSRFGSIRRRDMARRSRRVLERFGIAVEPRAKLETLGLAQQTMVAIARALQDQEEENSGVLVLDEPTASLPAEEIDLLLLALEVYAAAGQAILFISHHPDEIVRVANRVSVLRDGAHVATVDGAAVTEAELVELIVGRPVDTYFPARAQSMSLTARLSVHSLGGPGVNRVDLEVLEGEIVGLAGLIGCGASELLRMIFGADRAEGRILIDNQELRLGDPPRAIASGIAYIPADRASHALFPERSVVENITMACVSDYFLRGRLRHRAAVNDAAELARRFRIRAPSMLKPVSQLSGGNQQKVVVARWLRRNPRLLLLDEPTQGVDVGARTEIWASIRDAVVAGSAALVVSSDFEELAQMCDRVLVVSDGSVAAELTQPMSADQITGLVHSAEVTANGEATA
jgi:ribose transport system ATP-binding protein